MLQGKALRRPDCAFGLDFRSTLFILPLFMSCGVVFGTVSNKEALRAELRALTPAGPFSALD